MEETPVYSTWHWVELINYFKLPIKDKEFDKWSKEQAAEGREYFDNTINRKIRTMEEKMETLKDIKEALDKIPVEVLKKCQWGIGENSEDKVSLLYMDDNFGQIFEKYPQLGQSDNLVENIKKAQTIMNDQDKAEQLSEDLQQDGVSDTFFDKKD